MSATAPEFTFTRIFDAPRDRVWKALTDIDHLKHWWGPTGFTWLGGTLDLKPGGLFHYGMRSPNGQDMWGKFVFREVVAPERLVFVNSFSDAQGGTTRHPMAPNWPAEVLNAWTLSEKEGRTTLHLRGTPINASEEERKIFTGGFESMRGGFGATLDQLAAYLPRA